VGFLSGLPVTGQVRVYLSVATLRAVLIVVIFSF